jgi:hypothetical protein
MDQIEPPSDPNQWSDEKWLDWLKATDNISAGGTEGSTSDVVERIVQSTPGQVIGLAMLGMAQAIYGRQEDEIVIMVERNGPNTGHQPFAVRLDFDHPERSFVDFR